VPIVDLTLPLQSSPAEDAWGGQTRLVNCYAVPLERGKSEVVIHATDGLAPLATITGAGGIRAMAAVTEAEGLVVAGRVVQRIDTAGTATLVGALPSDGHVGITQNADGEVALVCDGLYFSYVGGVLTQLSDPDLPPPLSVCSLKGYFVYMLADGRMFASDLNDFEVEGLSYAQNEQAPDGGVVGWVRGNDLLGGGKRSIEVWQINPSAEAGTFPFAPVTTIIEPATQQTIGVLSADSAIDGLFVASDKTVKLLDGYSAVTISPPALNRAIADDPAPSAISATRWSSRGYTFYAFSGTSWTWVYNATTKAWHEQKSYSLDRWRVSKVMDLGGTLIAGHYDTGTLYTLDHDTHTEARWDPDILAWAYDPHVMDVYSIPVADVARRMRHAAMYLDIAPGTIPTNEDRHVELAWSDMGEPFGHEARRSLGAPAQTRHQVRFGPLGSSFNRTYRIRISAPGRRALYGAKLDLSQMGRT
jgi:hypothetical protein